MIAQFPTVADATAELAAPIVLFCALVGVGLTPRERWRRPEPWAAGAAAAVFAVYAAPVVLSGASTFAGFLKLDDTATWMALTDRVMEHGRSLHGLAPSTYEATLAFNLADGYPVGVFLPLGVGQKLIGVDVAWLVQPYMTLVASLLALALWQLASRIVESRPLRALAVFLGAQAALLYGYALWGGIKEVVAAALIATLAAVMPWTLAEPVEPKRLLPAAVVAAALLGVLSVGGAIWLAPLLIPALVALARGSPQRAGRAAAAFAGLVVVLSLPLFSGGRLLPPTSSPLTSGVAKGNLYHPLDPLQFFGIWPSGDFRVDPSDLASAHLLILVVALTGAAGIWLAWRRGAWEVALYAGAAVTGALFLQLVGSPWVAGKGLATASPAFLFAAAVGAAALIGGGRRVEGVILMAALAIGVGWSTVLAYHDVNLAPKHQLEELRQIGEQVAGEGPTLMTEYEPYGVRHFLRDSEAEGVSELRRNLIPLRNGQPVIKGYSADTDRLDTDALLTYRTLVLRRSPAQSRPPLPYRLVRSGDTYEVWQRGPGAESGILEHLPLGDATDAQAVPACGDVERLASVAGPGGHLVAAGGGAATVAVALVSGEHPSSWARARSLRLFPDSEGSATVSATVAAAGRYMVWIEGSVRGRIQALVDGEPGRAVRGVINNEGGFIDLGEFDLGPGRHTVRLDYSGPDWHPGSGGGPFPIGPLVLASGADRSRLTFMSPEGAASLCGRRWDWIEAVQG